MPEGIRPRPHRVSVRLSPEEYEHVLSTSAELALTPSEFMRRLSLKKQLPRRGAFDRDAQREIWKEIHAIGKNINQLAHNSNRGVLFPPEDLNFVREALQKMVRKFFDKDEE